MKIRNNFMGFNLGMSLQTFNNKQQINRCNDVQVFLFRCFENEFVEHE